MSIVQRIGTTILTLALAAGVGAAAWWLVTHSPAGSKAEKPPPAASVSKVVKEDELNTVTLSAEAEKRIGLTVGAVEKKAVRRVRVYGGEVAIPPGRAILVAAPLGGTLKAPAGGVPKAGQAVKAGQPIFLLAPLLTPDGRASLSASLADVDGQVNTAKTQVELAKVALERARRVLKEGAGSQRQVDEAQAAAELAAKTFDAATARRAILAGVVGDVEAGTAVPLPIDAPESGILRVVSALPGQTVPSGAALVEVVDLSTVWVRVPVPLGDLDGIDRVAAVRVGKLSATANATSAPARPVTAPPSANPLAGTIDLYYELPNPSGSLVPAQRLAVDVPLRDSAEAPTVPWSAVVTDTHGGTWVYERLEPRRFVRKRVEVKYTAGAEAVLATGPAAGTPVVTAGVQELFGAETGFIK